MILKIEQHLEQYRKKLCELPSYQEMIGYVEDIKIIGFKKGIKIALLQQNKSPDYIINYLNSVVNISVLFTQKTKLELYLEQHRFKEIEYLSYNNIYVLYKDLLNVAIKEGFNYCQD